MTRSSSQYASFGQRVLAVLVDGTILSVVMFFITSILYPTQPFLEVMKTQTLDEFMMLYEGTPLWQRLLPYAIGLIYVVYFWVSHDGATPGKKLLGIKVKAESGSITVGKAVARFVGRLISSFVLSLGNIWMLFDSRNQTWHDKIAKTTVVKTSKKPQTLAAVLLAVLFLVVQGGMVAAIASKYATLITETSAELSNNSAIQLRTYREELSAESLQAYERSEELFDEIRENGTDRDEVIRLNDENIAILLEAIEADPENPLLYYSLSNAYTWANSNGSLEDGLAAAEKAVELAPDNAYFQQSLGSYYLKFDDNNQAVVTLQKAVRLQPTYAAAYRDLGSAYAKMDLDDQAIEALTTALEITQDANVDGQYDREVLSLQKAISDIEARQK